MDLLTRKEGPDGVTDEGWLIDQRKEKQKKMKQPEIKEVEDRKPPEGQVWEIRLDPRADESEAFSRDKTIQHIIKVLETTDKATILQSESIMMFSVMYELKPDVERNIFNVDSGILRGKVLLTRCPVSSVVNGKRAGAKRSAASITESEPAHGDRVNRPRRLSPVSSDRIGRA